MPPKTRVPTASAKAGSSCSSSSKKPSKYVRKEKPALSDEVRLQKKWKRLHDQVAGGFLEKALETCEKILAIDSTNALARQTQVQLLLSLDRYKTALRTIKGDADRDAVCKMEKCYALYKLGRMEQAKRVLDEARQAHMSVDEDADEEQRIQDILGAQINYRLEHFSDAQLLYEDLLATADTESPEHADLAANLDACNAHLDFLASVPSRVGDLANASSSSNRLPSTDVLESTPIAPLLASFPAYKVRPVKKILASAATGSELRTGGIEDTEAAKPVSDQKRKAKAAKKGRAADGSKKIRRLPKSIASIPEDKRPAPDPERWLPKRERKGYAEVLAAREREKEKKRMKARKKLEATMTQGAAASDSMAATGAGSEQSKTNAAKGQQQGKSSNSNKKKKKGGK